MSSGVSVDEFQALEQRVLRAVEIVKQEREARAAAEAELGRAREELAAVRQQSESHAATVKAEADAAQREFTAVKGELEALHGERDNVRRRVEKLLAQLDELG